MSMDRQREVEHLNKAEADIGAGETRVTEQVMRIERLRSGGRDTREAERFLQILKRMLAEWQQHREDIIKTIRQIDANLT